jgi:hypothetical protein
MLLWLLPPIVLAAGGIIAEFVAHRWPERRMRVVVAPLCGILAAVLSHCQENAAAELSVNVARPRTLPRLSFPATFVFGSNVQRISQPGPAGFAFSGPELQIQEDRTMAMPEGIRNSKGVLIAELNNSVLTGIPGQCDVNSDGRAFEVVSKLVPVLQIVFKEHDSVVFFHYSSYSYSSIYPKNLIMSARSAVGRLPPQMRDMIQLEPIFKYRGYEYPGVRTNEAKHKGDLELQTAEAGEQVVRKLSAYDDAALAQVLSALCHDLRSLCSAYAPPSKSPAGLEAVLQQSPEEKTLVSRYLQEYAGRATAIRQVAQSRRQIPNGDDASLHIWYAYPPDRQAVDAVQQDVCALSEQFRIPP